MEISTKFDLEQSVYLITDKEQQKRMVIGMSIRSNGVMYDLAFGSSSTWHYEIEISEEENVLTKIT